VTKVARVSARFSKSLARRRLRSNQEKVRSTTSDAAGDRLDDRVIYDDELGVLYRKGEPPRCFRLLPRPRGDFESAVYMLEEIHA
jgi:hypothetical protein